MTYNKDFSNYLDEQMKLVNEGGQLQRRLREIWELIKPNLQNKHHIVINDLGCGSLAFTQQIVSFINDNLYDRKVTIHGFDFSYQFNPKNEYLLHAERNREIIYASLQKTRKNNNNDIEIFLHHADLTQNPLPIISDVLFTHFVLIHIPEVVFSKTIKNIAASTNIACFLEANWKRCSILTPSHDLQIVTDWVRDLALYNLQLICKTPNVVQMIEEAAKCCFKTLWAGKMNVNFGGSKDFINRYSQLFARSAKKTIRNDKTLVKHTKSMYLRKIKDWLIAITSFNRLNFSFPEFQILLEPIKESYFSNLIKPVFRASFKN